MVCEWCRMRFVRTGSLCDVCREKIIRAETFARVTPRRGSNQYQRKGWFAARKKGRL